MSATNPGNLNQAAGVGWEGSVRGQTDRNGHASFEDYQGIPAQAWGVRAIVRNLQQYYRKGHYSVFDIIWVWAPPGDRGNDPRKYAATVAAWMRVSMNQPLHLFGLGGKVITNLDRLVRLIHCIAIYENGHDYNIPVSNILTGIALAQRKWFDEKVCLELAEMD